MSAAFDYDSADSCASGVADNLETVKASLLTLWGALEAELAPDHPSFPRHLVPAFRRATKALNNATESIRIVLECIEDAKPAEEVPEAPASETRVKASATVGKQKAAR